MQLPLWVIPPLSPAGPEEPSCLQELDKPMGVKAMPTVTVPRANLTAEEVVTVLRDGLGEGYNVLPGMAIGQVAFQATKQGTPNTIVVGTGNNQYIKAQVTITPHGEQTELRIRPGGLTMDLLINTFGISREIRKVLADSPSLSGR
jgi:hypothetical protein